MSRPRSDRPPRVSVCLPAYLAEPYLAATIESVLAQTFTGWELIVLDNASTDRTGEIARSFDDPRIRVVANPSTIPLADNWNAVISLATAPYVKLLCADDLLAPECLARAVDVLDHHDEVVMVACRRDFISSTGEVVLRNRGLTGLSGLQRPETVVDRVVRSGINPIGWPSALLIRRSDFQAVGGFDRRWLHPIDLDLWLRLLARGALYGLAESLASFRISEHSLTARIRNPGAQYREMVRAFAEVSPWPIGRYALARGNVLSRIERVRLRLLFRAVNSRRSWFRKLPTILLDQRGGSRLGSGGTPSVEVCDGEPIVAGARSTAPGTRPLS